MNKWDRIDEVILCNNKFTLLRSITGAKNIDIAKAKARLFNEVSVQKNKTKYISYLFTNPILKI